jgi:hypothetical protein
MVSQKAEAKILPKMSPAGLENNSEVGGRTKANEIEIGQAKFQRKYLAGQKEAQMARK